MPATCPGQDMRFREVELHKCSNCGYEVEIFSGELRVKCFQCGEWVNKEQLPSCIDWCAAASECLGPERYQELKGEKDGGIKP
ncbi:MAG: phosphohydrolase [Dehalococcoidia bacterium]